MVWFRLATRQVACAFAMFIALAGFAVSSADAQLVETRRVERPTVNRRDFLRRAATATAIVVAPRAGRTREARAERSEANVAKVQAVLRQQAAAHEKALMEFVRIASIGADPAHAKDMQRSAKWLAEYMRQAGFPHVEIHQTPGNPAVVAMTEEQDGKPTILVYGHHDVVPATEPQWTTQPFEPVRKNGRIFARGASDNKGQLLLCAQVVDAYRRAGIALPVQIKFLAEGDEEVGGPHLVDFLKAHRTRLANDIAIVSDSNMLGRDRPSITNSLRGFAGVRLTVTTGEKALHSGGNGGAVPNASLVIAQLLARAVDPNTGHVLIPGFYKHVIPLTESERAALLEIEKDGFAEQFLRQTGVVALNGDERFSVLERIGARPTFDTTSVHAGHAVDAPANAIPPQATARVAMRLVPKQDPVRVAKLAQRFFQERAPPYAKVEVEIESGKGKAYRVPVNDPYLNEAVAAVTDVFGRKPVLLPEGGSLPVVSDGLKGVLGSETLLVGFGLAEDNIHAPNESASLEMLALGRDTLANFYDRVGAMPR